MVSLKNLGVTKRGTKSEEQTTERENEKNKIKNKTKNRENKEWVIGLLIELGIKVGVFPIFHFSGSL